MGDIADGIVDGLFCEECCGLVDGEESGYPRTCADCKGVSKKRRNSTRKRGKKNVTNKHPGKSGD